PRRRRVRGRPWRAGSAASSRRSGGAGGFGPPARGPPGAPPRAGRRRPPRLAPLGPSRDLPGHGIAPPPTLDLPEPWLSLLAHYQRRKPEPSQMREGYAALAATLPELDGIRVTLLGLQHTQGSSVLHVLAQGPAPEPRP